MKTAVNVEQTTTGTGTGDLTLAAASAGYQAFLDAFNASGGDSSKDWFPYFIEDDTNGDWEYGTAQIVDDAANGELDRTGAIVFASSNSDALVDFGTGIKNVRCITPPSVRQLRRGASVRRTSTASFPASGATTVTFTTQDRDTDALWDSGEAGVFYIPSWAEVVEVYCHVSIQGATDARLQCNPSDVFDFDFYEPAIYIGSDQEATLRTVLHVDRSLLSTNTKAQFSFQMYNLQGASSITYTAEAWVNIIE